MIGTDIEKGGRDRPLPVANLASLGGLLAALGLSTCCVIPFTLAALGVSGAWIGRITGLAIYQPYFLIAAILCLSIGFYFAYRPVPASCKVDSHCARPASRRPARIGLWAAFLLFKVAIFFPWIEAYL